MDESKRTAQHLWGQFSVWFRGAGRGAQIGVAVGTLVVICVCCSVGLSALGRGGASSTATSGIVAHQTTASAIKATATKAATKVPMATARTTAVSGVTTATLGGPETAFIATYGAPTLSASESRDHRGLIQGEDVGIIITLNSASDATGRTTYIRIQPWASSTTWSNSQVETIAKTFLPSDAVYVKERNVADFGTEHLYTSKLLAASFPANAFTDLQSGNQVAPGMFYLACGDQTDGQGKCSMQLGE